MSATGFSQNPHELLRVGEGFDLSGVDPGSTPGFEGSKEEGSRLLARYDDQLSELQERLFAASRGGARDSVLLILQGMDTSGKGGIVRHVIGAVDPQGIRHHAFKQPAGEELMHDFLWRVAQQLPGYGMIGCFDRSHYEDVLVHRVRGLSPLEEVEARYGMINGFESRLAGGGMRIVKVMLHISRKEGQARLQERLDRPDKYWKYNPGDVDERRLWDEYMQAYQIALERTSTDYAPWFVVPANRKWYARLAVQQLLLHAMQQINPRWPEAQFDVETEKKRLAES
ncbi:polyphosphate kinase 2 family protein, partial [Arthrobacter deserti]|nr:polyphosphate kinase 2 family protein [Arthrobacter deserti]